MGPAGTTACANDSVAFQTPTTETGVPLAHERTDDLTSGLTSLGIALDLEKGMSSLPMEKQISLKTCCQLS